nr:hypothetical protein [Amycolatopsis panacis]
MVDDAERAEVPQQEFERDRRNTEFRRDLLDARTVPAQPIGQPQGDRDP